MHPRHGHPYAAPAGAPAWRTTLCLALGSCLIAVTASAQTGTGTGTYNGTGNALDPQRTTPLIGAGEAPAAGTTPRGSATEPSLAAQDQHGTGGSYASYGSAYAGSDYSWIPYTRRGYVGISLGNSDYDTPCGLAPLSCDSRDRSFALYTGGMFNDFLGLELGLRHFGKADRAGGEARAYGANLSLVGMVDMENVSFYAKAGALYGHTRITADPLSGVTTGTQNGWGPTATLGVGFNFNRNFTVSIERSRDRFKLPGGESSYVQSTALALKYRF